VGRRTIDVAGERWEVFPSGRITVYGRDEFGLVFETGDGAGRVRRVTRYSPLGARRWEASLHELSDAQLERLFHHSQPAWTSPETRYRRVG
jgi:hypothetical protein